MVETGHILSYLESILWKFVANETSKETDIMKFFKKSLKPSIKVKTEQKRQEFETWEEVIKKEVEAKVKLALQPVSDTREINHECQ